MKFIAHQIVRFRRLIVLIFAAAAAVCGILSTFVSVNYDMVDYLPKDALSTRSIDIMNEQYDQDPPNLRVLVPDVSIPQALEIKRRLKAIENVKEVSWLDDTVSVNIPLETLPESTVDAWYKNGTALFSLTLGEGDQTATLEAVRTAAGESCALSGSPVEAVSARASTGREIATMLMIVIPIFIVILMVISDSYIAPLLFLAPIGVSIVLNNGTNLIFGEISFITQITGSVLQLAVSMDYAIFLLDRFNELRAEGLAPRPAMEEAVVSSFSSIMASGLTTVTGFLALCVMRFRIGSDMGIVLAKGIAFSLVSVLVFMPALTLSFTKLMDKTHHANWIPPQRAFAGFIDRFGAPFVIVITLLIIPAFLSQRQIEFRFGNGGMFGAKSQVVAERDKIDEAFGKSVTMVIMVPKGEFAREKALVDDLHEMPVISSVTSYVETVGSEIPVEYVPENQVSKLISRDLSRIIVIADVDSESPATFRLVEDLRSLSQKHFGDDYYIAGEAANVYDMRETILADTNKVNFVSIGAIWLILLFTFKSLPLPLFLLLTIETSIWINLSFPYYLSEQLNYIGYLIISSVQLGATVDYAILLTNRYLENRKTLMPHEAVQKTLATSTVSIITSAGILTIAGVVLTLTSSNMVIAQLGTLLARGATLSCVLVLVFLPVLLMRFDTLIQKTTYGIKLRKKGDSNELAVIQQKDTPAVTERGADA